MAAIYNYSHARAAKARFAGNLSKSVVLACRVLAAGLVGSGVLLMMTGQRLGGLAVGAGTCFLLLALWHYGELSDLPATLPAEGRELALETALDQTLLSRLPAQPGPGDVWDAIKKDNRRQFFAIRFGLDDAYFEGELQGGGINLDDLWQNALELARRYDLKSIDAGAVTVALFLQTPSAAAALNHLRIEQTELSEGLAWLKQIELTIDSVKRKEHYGGLGRDWAAGYTPLLNRLAQNVSRDIQHGGLWVRDTASRGQVVDKLLATLAGSRTSSVALIGELGVGKTTAVYALAKKLLTEKVPSLRYHQIFALDASALIASAGSYQSVEQLLLGLFGEAAQAGNIILLLDEAQLFMRAGTGSIDLTNVLLSVLQSGRVRLICSMTTQEWQLLVSTKPALAGLLNYQVLPVPGQSDSLRIMEDQLLVIEHKHKVAFMYQAVREAYRLADKYVQEQAFPGRGIQVLEETAVFAGSGLITPDVVDKALEAKLGVKVGQVGGNERRQLLNLEDELHNRLINQTRAVSVVADALRRARSGVSNPNRPVGTFLFLGPTGVGKTELAKALADVYFGGRDQIVRVNLNEYSQAADVERLLTPVSQDSAGTFLAAIRRQPYSVVLLDEIEKAHPEVLNVLLQLLDEGVVRDHDGRDASFRDAILIATSNAGADSIRQQIQAGRNLEEFEEEFTNQLIDQNLFKPEFLNRFDEIVLFRPLRPDELAQVVQLMINEINRTLERQKVRVEVSPAAVDWLVAKGNDPRLGARPMRRQVQRSVENVVARRLLSGEAGAGSVINLDISDLETGGVQA